MLPSIARSSSPSFPDSAAVRSDAVSFEAAVAQAQPHTTPPLREPSSSALYYITPEQASAWQEKEPVHALGKNERNEAAYQLMHALPGEFKIHIASDYSAIMDARNINQYFTTIRQAPAWKYNNIIGAYNHVMKNDLSTPFEQATASAALISKVKDGTFDSREGFEKLRSLENPAQLIKNAIKERNIPLRIVKNTHNSSDVINSYNAILKDPASTDAHKAAANAALVTRIQQGTFDGVYPFEELPSLENLDHAIQAAIKERNIPLRIVKNAYDASDIINSYNAILKDPASTDAHKAAASAALVSRIKSGTFDSREGFEELRSLENPDPAIQAAMNERNIPFIS